MSKYSPTDADETIVSALKGFIANNPPTNDDIRNVIETISMSYTGEKSLLNKLADQLSDEQKEGLKKVSSKKLVNAVLDSIYNKYKNQVEASLSLLKAEIDYIKDGLKN